MNAYTVSRLAADAGVSVHVVRDYVLRGLLQPARRTESGYGVFDVTALQRLRFVRTAFEAGIGLDTLAQLCLALDARDAASTAECLADLRRKVASRRNSLAAVEAQLATMMPCPLAQVGKLAGENDHARR